MQIYLKPILTACYTFPFLALLFTIPYMIRQYNKFGAILVLKTGIVYSFIFYLLTSYFMTILPLPPIDSVTPDSSCVLLTPFDAIRRWLSSVNLHPDNINDIITIFCQEDFLQIVFNILLLLPFGVYLRYYFNRKCYQVLILAFLYSLFFELTQLSALYGIYPYPYRYFEVDDLICNTLGAIIGYFITPVFVFFLPKKERLDEIAYKKGVEVSSFRRGLALFIDYFIFLSVNGIILYFIDKKYDILFDFNLLDNYNVFSHKHILFVYFLLPVLSVIYFFMQNIIFNGRTIGKALVSIKICTKNKKIFILQLLARNIMLHGIIMPLPFYLISLIWILTGEHADNVYLYSKIGIGAILCIMFFAVLNFTYCFVGKNTDIFYDWILKLKVVSTTKNKLTKDQQI